MIFRTLFLEKVPDSSALVAVFLPRAQSAYFHVGLEVPGALEAQPQAESLALLERLGKFDEHEMRAAGLELAGAARGNVERL